LVIGWLKEWQSAVVSLSFAVLLSGLKFIECPAIANAWPLAATIKPLFMPQGNCSLCGIFCDLTFEHVPPRSAFNKNTRYKTVPYEQVLKSDNILDANFKGKIEQGGLGHYSLCSNCNSF
jgi:hypothetical protein